MKNFTENLNKNDIEEFIKNPVIDFRPRGEGGYIMCSINSFGPRPEFIYDSFTFKGINSYTSYDYSIHWRKFVLSKLNDEEKKEYIEEFNANLEKLKLSL